MAKTLKDIIAPRTGRVLTKREEEILAMHSVEEMPKFYKVEGGEAASQDDEALAKRQGLNNVGKNPETDNQGYTASNGLNTESEQIEELSKDFLTKYRAKSRASFRAAHFDKYSGGKASLNTDKENDKTMRKRGKGMYLATNALAGKKQANENEEIEEISKAGVINYYNKAQKSYNTAYADKNHSDNKPKNSEQQNNNIMRKRTLGMSTAVKRYQKVKNEEVDLSEEVKTKNLADHVSDAIKSAGSYGASHDSVHADVHKAKEAAPSYIHPDHPAMKHIQSAVKRLAKIKPDASPKNPITKNHMTAVRQHLQDAHAALTTKPKVRVQAGSSVSESIEEKLGPDATVGDYIDDFVHSDNARFKGKSKEKRRQMAIAAYYARMKQESVLYEAEEQDDPNWEALSQAAKELVLFADTDYSTSDSAYPIRQYLRNEKLKENDYSPKKAYSIWQYVADRAARTYSLNYGSKEWFKDFSPAERKEAAKFMADRFFEFELENAPPPATPWTPPPVVAREQEEVAEKWHVVSHDNKLLHSGETSREALKVHRANAGSRILADKGFHGQRASVALGNLLKSKIKKPWDK